MKFSYFTVIFIFGILSIISDLSAKPLRVLFLGDSITIGYGLKIEEAYPKLIEEKLNKDGLEIEAVNGGVSGDTTAGGLRRLEWMLRLQPDVVVIALGANDMLRGLPPTETHKNIFKMIELLRSKKIDTILFGMRALPNYGPRYEKEFNRVYENLAKETGIPYKAFFISTVAGKSNFNLSDGIHPNREGQKVLAEDLVKFLRPQLERLKKKGV